MTVIRLYPWSADFDKSVEMLKNMKDSCDEVWLGVYGYVSLEEQRERVVNLTKVCDELKAAGIRPVLEFGSNFGHVPEAPVTDVTAPFEKMVGLNGKAATGAFCPRGPKFLAYEKEVAQIMAKMHPWGMYIDDDLRIEFRNIVGVGCFCDRCIAEFNKKHGTDYTREEIARRLVYDVDLREKYINHNNQAMHDYAYMMAKEVAKENPDICAGWENCFLGAFNGPDFKYVFEGLHEATGNPVMSRSGAFVYNDHNPRNMLDKVLNTSYQNSILPDYVTVRRPEIENTDDFSLGKSIQGTCVEATLNLALGCNGVSFHMSGTGIEPMRFRERMWQAFADYRTYWLKLKELNENTGVSGLIPAYFPDTYKAVLKTKDALLKDAENAGVSYENYNAEQDAFVWACPPKEKGRELLQIGLPLSYETKFCKAYLLHPDMLSFMSDSDIRLLLSSNVLTDGKTIIRLAEMGYGDMLPVSAKVSSGLYDEYYMEDSINGDLAGEVGMTDQFVPVSFQELFVKEGRNEDVRILSKRADYPTPEQPCKISVPEVITSLLCKTSLGGSWGIIGTFLWGTLCNSVKRSAIMHLADYLAGGLPAFIENSEQVAIFPRTDKSGSFVCATLQNISISDSDDLTLIVRNPVNGGKSFVLAEPGIAPENYRKLTVEKSGKDYRISVPSIRGWHCATVIAE